MCYHMDDAYGWMFVHTYSVYVTRTICIHVGLMALDIFYIKKINQAWSFALDKEHIHTLLAYVHTALGICKDNGCTCLMVE